MNAFTSKPDLSKFVKQTAHAHQAKKAASKSVIRNGGQAVPGMGERDESKVRVNLKRPNENTCCAKSAEKTQR
jgi:hypothetical protein